MNTEFDVIVAGLIGFVIGAVLVGIMSYSGRGRKNTEETSKLQAEFDAYREQVNAHFAKTADAVDGLTKSYQQVFDHLSDGAQNLMDKKALQAQLEKRQGKAVTLAYLVDQDEVEQADKKAKVSEVKAASIVGDAAVQKAGESAVKAETSAARTEDKAKAATADAGKVNTAIHGAASVQPKADAVAKPASAAPVAQTAAAPGGEASAKAVDSKENNALKAAERAGVKPAEKIVKTNEHETAIESVKKHIKDNNSQGKKS